MNRHRFLGSTDLSIVDSLLTNYNVPTKIPNGIKLNQIKHQDDLCLIELGTLLTPNECDEIISNINRQTFEDMAMKYGAEKRNSSRLIVMDDRLGRTLWRRLKFSNKLPKLVQNTTPLGFNVQGQWVMSGVNPAMRLNAYANGDYFSAHKDAQYAPSGDERSLLSLLIYLNDDFEKGETKFYFPKQLPKSDVKGLTIAEEIESYGGLENGFECISLKPTKGFAVLFTHNVLHEAMPPEISNCLNRTKRLVLRSDVLVKRKNKPLGFAVCSEEKEDYLASLNFFRQAQMIELEYSKNWQDIYCSSRLAGNLYERSLSIRYCYPRLLQSKLQHSNVDKNQDNALIKRLPSELWLRILRLLHEQDVLHFIYAFPQFQLLKILWDAEETKDFIADPSRPKYLPTIKTQYGSRTLFCFPDSEFFYRHIDGCCRVVAVYAFFLLGHGKDSTTYIVRYDKNTHEVCEVQMEKILADAFYNRNCYGSLYRVEQKDKKKRQPIIDLDHSVDRTYLTNQQQSQFIGQDLLSRFHFETRDLHATTKNIFGFGDEESSDTEDEIKLARRNNKHSRYYKRERRGKYKRVNQSMIRSYEQQHALHDSKNELVDHIHSYNNNNSDDDDGDGDDVDLDRENDTSARSYCEHLMKQNSGSSLFRMISATDHFIDLVRKCRDSQCRFSRVRNMIRHYNHLVFDFNTHHLTVERLTDIGIPRDNADSLLHDCVNILERSVESENPISYYRVNIEQLAKEIKGFNHASMQTSYPAVNIDQFSFLDYTHLSHVHLAVAQNKDQIFVLATYGGITAM